MPTFALIAENYPAKVPWELADALHVVLQMPLLDARMTAARTRGIWVENVEEGPANIMQKMLAACGHPASVVEQSRVVPPIQATRVQRVLLAEDGITFYWNYRDACDKFAWESIAGFSAGLVYVERIVRKSEVVDSGMFHYQSLNSHVETKTVDESTTEPSCLLALAADNDLGQPSLRFVRLRGRGIQYAETFPDATPAQSSEYFRLFLARIGNLANQARIAPQTTSVVAGQKRAGETFPDPNFASDEEHEAHFRWFLTRNPIFR